MELLQPTDFVEPNQIATNGFPRDCKSLGKLVAPMRKAMASTANDYCGKVS